MHDRYPESAWPGLRDVVKNAPLGRHGTAAEVSAAVVFLMSEMAAYITGIELLVDGGIHLGGRGFLFQRETPRNSSVFQGFHRDERSRLLEKEP